MKQNENSTPLQPGTDKARDDAGESPAARMGQFAPEMNIREVAVRLNLQAGRLLN